jgi:hypothetical protein
VKHSVLNDFVPSADEFVQRRPLALLYARSENGGKRSLLFLKSKNGPFDDVKPTDVSRSRSMDSLDIFLIHLLEGCRGDAGEAVVAIGA